MRRRFRGLLVGLALLVGGPTALALAACSTPAPAPPPRVVAVSDDWYEPGEPLMYHNVAYCLYEFDGDIECPGAPHRVYLVRDMSYAYGARDSVLALLAWHYSMRWHDRYWDTDRFWNHYGYGGNPRYASQYTVYQKTVTNIYNSPTAQREMKQADSDPRTNYKGRDGKPVAASKVQPKSTGTGPATSQRPAAGTSPTGARPASTPTQAAPATSRSQSSDGTTAKKKRPGQ